MPETKLYGFKISVNGGDACIVFRFIDDAMTSINLFGDYKGYNYCYGRLHGYLTYTAKLENKDPDGHDVIHKKMGELMGKDPESTMTFGTHFHWVGTKNLSEWPVIVLEMKKFGLISGSKVQEIFTSFKKE